MKPISIIRSKWVYILAFITCYAMLSMSSCEKDPPLSPDKPPCVPFPVEHPPLTHVGANVLSALVDGMPWQAKIDLVNGGDLQKQYPYYPQNDWAVWYVTNRPFLPSSPFLRLYGVRRYQNECDTAFSSISFTANNINGPGEYRINPPYPFSSYTKYGIGGFHALVQDDQNKLIIDHLDTIHKTISGRFQFNCLNYWGEMVEVREGRFDAVYRPNDWEDDPL